MTNNLTTVSAWLYTTLSNDATITGYVGTRIYWDQAPEGVAFPYIVYGTQITERDNVVIGGGRVWSTAQWLVRAIDKDTSYADAKAIANRIDTLLHAVKGTGDGGVIYESVREEPFNLTEVVDRVRYVHLGGIYRIRAN